MTQLMEHPGAPSEGVMLTADQLRASIVAGVLRESPEVTVARKIYSELDDFSQSIISFDFVLHCVKAGMAGKVGV
jgi:hypothetical protein